MAWLKKIETILSRGVSLHEAGVNNWALNREEALAAIGEFEDKGIAVLGGDVYELSDGSLEPNYDSWYCDKKASESLEEFIHRSTNYSREYICNYTSVRDADIFFVFVVE